MAQQLTHTGLHRSRDAYVGGVCAGIAERCDFDPIVIRILAVLITVLTLGIGALVYIALWVGLPREAEPSAPYDITPERAESVERGSLDYASFADLASEGGPKDANKFSLVPRLAIAVGLVMLFLAVAMNVAPIVSGTHWWQFWPLGLLFGGLCLIVIPVRNQFEWAWHALGIVITSLAASMLPMSLGIVSWYTFAYAFEQMWPLLLVAVLLFGIGLYRGVDILLIVAAFFIVAFCLISLTSFSLPGEVEMLLVRMPDGRLLRIAIAQSLYLS